MSLQQMKKTHQYRHSSFSKTIWLFSLNKISHKKYETTCEYERVNRKQQNTQNSRETIKRNR